MNNCSFVGGLVADPTIKYFESKGVAKAVTEFTLALKRNFKNSQGEYDADFAKCKVFGKLAEVLVNHTKKGDKISVVARLHTRNYIDSDGKKVYVTEFIVTSFDFITKSKKAETNQNQTNSSNHIGSHSPAESDDQLPF